MIKNLVSCLLVFSGIWAYAQVPEIKNVQPNYAYPGQIISVQGGNLANNTQVTFGGVAGDVISRSTQLIEVKVPAGTLFDYISVLNTANHREARARIPYTMSFGGTPGLTATDFATEVSFAAETGLFDICMCDLDGDGLNDIAAANSSETNATVLLNTSSIGSLSFDPSTSTALSFGSNSLNVSCGDLNGDQKPELIFSESDDGQKLFILTNNSTVGNINFIKEEYTVSGNSTKRIIVHDLDSDGRPEIIVSDLANPKVSIIRNNSSGGTLNLSTTTLDITIPDATNAASVQIADINGDNRPDIIVDQFLIDGGDIFISLNESTESNLAFGNFTRLEVQGTPVILKVADFNNDSRADLIFSQFLRPRVSILPNQTAQNGAPAFGPPVVIPTNESPWGIDLADFDGDGQTDLIVGSLGSPSSVTVIRNTSSGSTLSFSEFDIGVTTPNRNVSAGDLDGDGRPDIAFGGTNNNISILRNNKCTVPIIEPAGSLSICSGNTVTLSTQEIPGAMYEWQVDGSPVGTDPTFDVTTTSGNYTVTVTDAGGCSETSDALAVTVTGGPVTYTSPNFLLPVNPICIGGLLTLGLDDTADKTLAWKGPNGFTSSASPSISVSDFGIENSGRYEVDIFQGGCLVETKSFVVETVNSPAFIASSSPGGAVCQGESVDLTVSPTPVGFEFQWFDANGAISGAVTPTFTPTASGTYFARALDQVNTTCPGIDSNPIAVEILEPPVASFDAPTSSCINSPLSFTDNSTIASGATAAYSWDFGDGNGSNNPNPVHAYSTEGTFTVTLTVDYQGLTCQNVTTRSINIQPDLTIELKSTPEILCQGSTSEISALETYETYQWTGGETGSVLTINRGGTYTLTATDANGCSGSGTIDVSSFPSPIVEASANPQRAAPGQAIQLNASGLLTYNWEPANFVDNPNIADPIATIDRPTEFIVSGEDENGCPGSANIAVQVEGGLIGQLLNPKNFFSPNSEDNINPTWEIEGILEFPQCEVTIYDQTGNVLYQAKPYTNEWDGSTNGKDVPNGVYYFTVTCENEIAKTGSITLLR